MSNIALPDAIDIPILEVAQPIGSFYVGVMKAKDLRLIAHADVRRKASRELENHTGIQRELNKQREEEIRNYISSFGASFPNAFIIAIKSSDIVRQTDRILSVRADERVASLIDGQHRLAGFTDETSEDFEVVASIFIDLPLEEQAMLFATINLKQTKVNPSLVYDLFEETKLRSPQKTAHNICKSINLTPESPLFHQIKPLGKRTENFEGRITQATFVKRLLPHICLDPDRVRDDIRKRAALQIDAPDSQKCIFWKYFVEEKDWAILKILTNYFNAVRDVFPHDWFPSGSPLAKTIGFGALMRLLGPMVNAGLGKQPPTLERTFFVSKLQRAGQLAPFSFDKYPASGAGENALYHALYERVFGNTPN